MRWRGLARRLARQSIRVDAAESLPSWEGGPADYNWAIQNLRRRGEVSRRRLAGGTEEAFRLRVAFPRSGPGNG